jgi:hypothetical protein
LVALAKGDPAALARIALDLPASTLDLFASIATPCFDQVRSSCRSWSPSWRQLGATSPKICQKTNPEAKTAQETPNLHETCPKQLKNHSPDFRKSSKSDRLFVVFILFAIPTHLQKKTQQKIKIGQKSCQKKLESDQSGHLGSILATLGRNLLPTWSQLGPCCFILLPSFAEHS